MKTASDTTDVSSPNPAVAEEPRSFYEVTAEGPIKIGGVLAYRTAQVKLTKAQADALNAELPGSVKFLGV
jgi:hypothetical protein